MVVKKLGAYTGIPLHEVRSPGIYMDMVVPKYENQSQLT
jgi:hypothetical protein